MIDYCQKYQIDEVCVKIDTGTFTHHFPSFEWLENYQQILFQIKKELAEIGVQYSLNPNVTQGHADSGRHIDKQHPDWHMISDSNGNHATDCVCCISTGWREYIRKQWTLYAETKPVVIWLEDDVRTYNHEPIKTGCFCDEHMRRFNEEYGTAFTRQKLYKLITAPGAPDKARQQWLDFQCEIIGEMIALAEETVHKVSPDTIIGLMSSGPDAHACEGRDWSKFHELMSGTGKLPVASRPPLGSYREYDLPALLFTADMTRLTHDAFQKPIIAEGEIENSPYSGYSKSNLFTFLQCATALGAGCDALMLNLFDHCGTAMKVNHDILESLNDNKSFLSGIKTRVGSEAKSSGIRLYFNPKCSYHKELVNGQGILDLTSASLAWGRQLQTMGVATSFTTGPVTALGGQDIRAASDKEIKELLSGAVLCDAAAFLTLSQMGYQQFLGAKAKSQFESGTTYPLSGEHFYNVDFGGKKDHYFSMEIHPDKPLFVEFELDSPAVEISEMVGPDLERLCPGCYVFENELGGKIAVMPFECEKLSPCFADPTRKIMLYNLLKWLSSDRLPLFVYGDRRIMPLRNDFNDYSVVGIFNLSHDGLKDISAEMFLADREIKTIEYLSEKGVWEKYEKFKLQNKTLSINIPNLSFDKPEFFTVKYHKT